MLRSRLVAWNVLVVLAAACGGDGDDDGYGVPQPPTDASNIDARRPIDAAVIDARVGDAAVPGDARPDAPPNVADLEIAISDAPDPVAANSTLTYTIDVTNHGTRDAETVTVVQRLPAGNVAFQSADGIGWTCDDAGQLVTCTRAKLLIGAGPSIAVKVTTPATGGTLTSEVSVASVTFDGNANNDEATVETTVLTPADLSIAMADSPDPVAAGGTLSYAITVSNGGPGTASGLTVEDALPPGVGFVSVSGSGWSCSAIDRDVSCVTPALAPGASAAVTLVVTAPASGGTVGNTATVRAMTPDGNQSNNAATTSTTVNAAADLSIAMNDSPDPVFGSGTLQYLIDVNNLGPNTASGVTVSNGLPAGNVTFVGASGSGWTCNASGQVVTCTRPTLLVGAAPTITITVTAPSESTTLTNTATVASTSSDLEGSNNAAAATTSVLSAAELSIAVIDSPDPVTTNGTLSYTVTASNAGPSQAVSATVTTMLPANTSFVTASGINWTCSAIGQQVTCTTPELALGGAPPITITTTAPGIDGDITVNASVTAGTADPNTNNNAGSQTTTVNAPSDLALSLRATPVAAPASSTLTYTIDITNLGPRDATNLVVTNRLPDGNVQYLGASGIGWTCALAGQLVTCTRPLLLVGAAPSINIQITTPPVNGVLVDQASVTATTADPDAGNDSATITTNVFDSADLSIEVSDAPDPVRIGTNYSYTLAIGNNGPTAATAVSVDNALPAGATFVSAAGSGWTCSNAGRDVTCTRPTLAPVSSAPAITIVATAPATAATITNEAIVSSATSDPDPANNKVLTDTLANAFADLSVVLFDTPDPVQGTTLIGCNNSDCITYTFTVSNAGPDPATGLRVVITLPNNGSFYNAVGTGWVCPAPNAGTVTCTRASPVPLASGASPPNITLVWKAPSPGGFSILVSPTVSGSSTDPNLANNSAVEDTTVFP